MRGLVTKSTGSWYEVRDEQGTTFSCRIRGKIRLKGVKVTNPVAVGDFVQFSKENDTEGIIEQIEDRENYLIRRSTRKTQFGHILAANIDQVLLVATVTFPRTSIGFIDRFIVAAESFRIPTVLVVNKADMWNEEMKEYVRELEYIYKPLIKDVIRTSATQGIGMETLLEHIKENKSLIAGHSGVGKSTLLNYLSPDINQKTSKVSTFANKGTHTTTFAEMFEVVKDGFVIDTPGIKELGLIDIYDEEISHFFPEMRDLLGTCKFNNCTHTHEPGCEVIKALEAGQIAPSRYESYISMVTEEDTHR